ncbi:unnamed protein product [Rhizophagus irregularis]|nr:unnamed protein product [Rhizophagus irregularis]CAB5216217.1 unnamed protein product [Rhizophagus irregularis]
MINGLIENNKIKYHQIGIVTDNGSIDDDVLLVIDNTVFEEKAVLILWEYKNEIGTGGKDPSIQGGVTEKIRNSSCYPSIILAIAGSWICVLGAVYLENPVIELLTDFILMMNRPEDNGKRVEELAVFFESLHLAFQTLDNYYKGLKELDETEAEKIQRTAFSPKTVLSVSSTSSSMEPLSVAIDVC